MSDSITDRLQTQLAAGVNSRGHCRDQGQDQHVSGGHGDGPGRSQSAAGSVLAVQPPGSPVGGGRAGSTVSRQGCSSYGQSGQKRSQQQCRAGRIQGQVIQSHKVASSKSSGWQEREPRSTWRELLSWPIPRLKEAFLLRLLRTCEEHASRRRCWVGQTRDLPCARARRSLHECPVKLFIQGRGN